MAGVGAYSKLEGFAFLPITCMSMALPTFISQNLGAKEYNRAKKGAVFGIITGVAVAELIGIGFYIGIEPLLRFFVGEEQSVSYGEMHAHVTTLFFCLLLTLCSRCSSRLWKINHSYGSNARLLVWT